MVTCEAPSRCETASKMRALVKALEEILEANADFRKGMPDIWEGDPLQDACERASKVLVTLRKTASKMQMSDEQIAELQYEAGMYQSLYENAVKVLGEINRIVRVPTKNSPHRSAGSHFQSDFDAIRKMTASFSRTVTTAPILGPP